MRIVIPKKLLLGLVARTKGATDTKSSIPALANILLTATVGGPDGFGNARGQLVASATDLYRSSTAAADVEVTRPGAIALPAADLESRVRAMPEGPIEVEATAAETGLQTGTLRAVGAKRRFQIHGLSAEDFSAMPPAMSDGRSFKVPAATLTECIARVLVAVSDDETRAHVNSALLDWHSGGIRMVATDGHRLGLADATCDGIDGAGEVLIQKRALLELHRLCESAEGLVTVSVGGSWIFCEVGVDAPTVFGCKQVGAQFPHYQQVIPAAGQGREFTVRREALIDSLKAIAIASDDVKTGRGVRLTLADGTIRLMSVSSMGVGSDEVPCTYAGPEVMIGFNARYVIDALAVVGDAEVTLCVAGELDPLKVTACGGQYVAVVMPMRV